ncbi:ATP-binding protein [Variovorax paradoxus]|uniref:hybrid sensor histidine kinase/response regulator n=1 Tax=Variovorax paradoxus TaxID=34073 RepID=UPI0021AC02D6|nr:7TM diverse intracellular signaling domain-containing protein [Variovorax paradoxus]UVH59718.1 ATP-binding protein [Variovorax paradoxus]
MLVLVCGAASAQGNRATPALSAELAVDGHRMLQGDYLVEDGVPLSLSDVTALPGSAWKRRPWSSASYGFATAPHWFRSDPFTAGSNGAGTLLIEVGYPLLDHLDLYVRVNAAASWTRWSLGDKQAFEQRPHNAPSFVVPVVVQPGDKVEILARVQTEGAMRFPLNMWQPQQFESAEHLSLLVNGIYVGLMGGIFFYHLIIFLIVRERIYLYYIGWILATSGFILSYNGIAFQYLWPQATVWNDWSRIVFLFLAAGLLTSFTIQFVSNPATAPRRWHAAPVLLAVALAVGASWLPFPQAVRVALLVQFVGTLVCFGLAIGPARAGHIYARVFLVTFSGVLIGAALHALDMLGVTAYFATSINFEVAPQVGSAFSVLLFSLALAHRLLEERCQRSIATELAQTNATLAASMRVAQERTEFQLKIKDRLRTDAERRNQDKSRFLADAIHDLRQPLQVIGNALDPIGEAIQAGRTVNALSLVQMATRAADNMRSQLAAILDLSRLESGFVRAQLSDFELVSLIRDTVEQTRGIAHASGTSVEFDPPLGKPVFVRSDRHFLQRILLNLISNGIKYRSAEGGRCSHVRLLLTVHGRFTRLAIQDNGLGISEEALRSDIIFKPFFQLNNRHAETDKGVGLGLSIVSAMLDLLDSHQLSVQSEVGVGSTFTLEIPASVIAPVFEAIPLDDFMAGGVEAARGKYVVLLEDDELVRASLAAVFDVHGVLYEAWGSIEEMRQQLPFTERAPDVLLSDYRLPDGKTALDAIKLMRAHWSDVPTLILTGESLNSYAVESLRGAAICYKPVAPLDLLRRIAASAMRMAAPSNFGGL